MNLLIDASNLGSGGAFTQIYHFLKYCEDDTNITSVIVVTHQSNDIRHPDFEAFKKIRFINSEANKAYFMGIAKNRLIRKLVRIHKINAVFIPGFGTCRGLNIPVIVMFRNMLPLDLKSTLRYGVRLTTVRLLILRQLYKLYFKHADGVIFLNSVVYKLAIKKRFFLQSRNSIIIPHGVSAKIPEKQIYNKTFQNSTVKIIYVSPDDPYKNHFKLMHELDNLSPSCKEACEITFIGNFSISNTKKLGKLAVKYNIKLQISNPLERDILYAQYSKYDLAIFASSCENMPNILLEKMKAALPIFCHSNLVNNQFIRNSFFQFTFRSTELSSKIQHAIDNPSILWTSGQENLAGVQCYDWNHSTERILGYLKELSYLE